MLGARQCRSNLEADMGERNWLYLLFVAALLAGCNTIEGMGEDIEAAGGAIEKEAEEAGGD